MPTILALDTSTDACSCAVWRAGELRESFAVIPRRHAAELLPMIDALLAEMALGFADLDAIAFGRGPGSFTGLRIAAGVTQGLAYAANLPVVPVSTLEALALQTAAHGVQRRVLSVIDARIDEVYWALASVEGEQVALLGAEHLGPPETIVASGTEALVAVGSGLALLERFPAALRARLQTRLPDEHPRAGAIARIAALRFAQGCTVSALDAEPLYLRDQVAKVPEKP